MPADDLVLNVRQISGYPPVIGNAPKAGAILIQTAGLGSAYASMSPAAFVGTALAGGGDMTVNGSFAALSVSGGSAQFANGAFGFLSADKACLDNLYATFGFIGGQPIATTSYVDDSIGALRIVSSFNMRAGDVMLNIDDILCAGGAPIYSPVFQGSPWAPTPALNNYSQRVATTAFVQDAITDAIEAALGGETIVLSFNTRSGAITLTQADVVAAGGLIADSPALTGVPTAPTAAPGTNTVQLATTAFVNVAIGAVSAIYAPLVSPILTGQPTAPTADPGTATGQIATTSFVMSAIAAATAGVASFNGRTGLVVLEGGDISAAGGALLVSPHFTGVPTAPTAAPGNSGTQVASTAFVQAAISGSTAGVSSFNTRTGAVTLASADLTAVGGALLDSPAFTGVPIAPTAPTPTSTTQLATTAFVKAAIGAGSVVSFNGRAGAVTLNVNDISAAGGAPITSPAFAGVPTAPTPATGTATGQLATTAFVQNAIGDGAGVVSFNGRAGAVTLTADDLTAAGGALLASPAFTGVPTGPTAAPGVSSTQLATTAFVSAALGGFLPLIGGVLTGPLTGVSAAFSGALTVNGAATFAGNPVKISLPVGATFANSPTLDAPAGTVRGLFGSTNGSPRWRVMFGNSGPETGANAGSDFAISSFDDSGALFNNGFFINRANSLVNIVGVGGTAWSGTAGATPGNCQLFLNKSPGTFSAQLSSTSGGLLRWVTNMGESTPESGANAGSNWTLNRYNDAGVGLGAVMSAGRSTGVVTFTAAIVNGPSDRTLKENIAPIEGALDKVNALQGVSFNMLATPDKREIGLIAQDVEPVVPEIMQEFQTHDEEGRAAGTKLALDYPKLTALLIEAVKTLTARVAALEPAQPTRTRR